jgi:hypothetical protein
MAASNGKGFNFVLQDRMVAKMKMMANRRGPTA